MNKIIASTLTWELHLVGEVPPGIPRDMIEGTVIANYAILGPLLPFVKGQFVTVHEQSVDELKQALQALQSGPKLHS